MSQNSFHIVILFYNKPAMTIKCLESLLNIMRDNDRFDIILVNNGSDEANLKSVENKVSEINISCKFNASFNILPINPNKGFASGMNHGLINHFRHNSCPVICMSNDVELDAGFFDNLKIIYDAKSFTDAVYCPHVYYRMDKSKASYTHGIVDVDDLELSHHFDEGKKIMVFPEYYPAAATIWTKEAFVKTQGFNEKFYCYWEDVELSYRCAKYKTDLISSPELKIYHLGRGTTSGKKNYYDHFLKGKAIMRDILNGR
jgi:GT2 family glycosyltransferase